MMFRHGPTILTLPVALAGAADAPPPDPLDTIYSGSYAPSVAANPTARILNWNIDRGQHFKGIVAAMRETRPDLCIFQEVDLGARRTKGEDVARELAQTFGIAPRKVRRIMAKRFCPAIRSVRRASCGSHISPDFGSRSRC